MRAACPRLSASKSFRSREQLEPKRRPAVLRRLRNLPLPLAKEQPTFYTIPPPFTLTDAAVYCTCVLHIPAMASVAVVWISENALCTPCLLSPSHPALPYYGMHTRTHTMYTTNGFVEAPLSTLTLSLNHTT